MFQIAVIGGGASGMMAAINAHKKDSKVTLFEANDRVGKKILSTGNGKCNFTNEFISKDCYNGGDIDFIMNAINKFDRDSNVDFFRKLGMFSTIKKGGYYPYSGQANTVLDCLRNELGYRGVSVLTESKVTKIKKLDNGFQVFASVNDKKKEFTFDKVIVCIGSVAGLRGAKEEDHYSLLKNFELDFVPVVPSLVQLRCSDPFLKALSGVRFDGSVVLCVDGKVVASESGEVQLTDYGVSGIPTFQLSRFAGYALRDGKKPIVYLDFLPDISEEELTEIILHRQVRNTLQTAEEFFLGICNKKIMLQVMKIAGIKQATEACLINEKSKIKLAKLLKSLPLHVEGTNGFEQAQVCAGGLSLSEINENMMVKKIPGLYVAGEALDVDGRCGGYNLQWAFTSGYLAGINASLTKDN